MGLDSSLMSLWLTADPYRVLHSLKLQSVTFVALAGTKQNCARVVEEHCSRSYFSLFMSMANHSGTGLLRSGTYPNQSK